MSEPLCSVRKPRPARLDLLPHLYLALLLVLCALLVWRPLYGYVDFWVHAAAGRWIYQHGRVPGHSLFLWTADEPWVYHSWLSQLTLYGLTRLASADRLPAVVLGFTVVMVAIPFVLAWGLWGRRGRVSAWVLLPFVLALDISYPRFEPRPELFTMVLLAVELRLLVAWSAGLPQKLSRADMFRAAALVPLFAAWANFHGGVAAGLLLLGVTAACDLVQDRFSPRSRVLALLVPLAALAVLLNPYGLGYWRAFRPLGGETFAHIQEWQPLWRLYPVGRELMAKEAALLALAVLAWATNPARRWSHLGWLVVTAGLFASAVRHSWLLALVSLMVTAANAGRLDPDVLWQALVGRFGRRADGVVPAPPRPLRWLAEGGLAVWLCLEIVVQWNALAVFNEFVPSRLAGGAVRFIQDSRLTGHVLNDYENASYLQWRFAGEPALFADALNAYPDQVLDDYVDIMNVDQRGRALLAGDRLDWVLLTTNRPGPSLAPLADYLDRDSHWMRVYAGGDGVIWVRRTPEADRRWQAVTASVDTIRFRALELYNGEPTP